MDGIIDQSKSKRKRHITDDFPASNVDLRLKLMGESLKSRLDCEIEAFCSNIQSLMSSRRVDPLMTSEYSPPQMVPRRENVPVADDSEIIEKANDPESIACQRQLIYDSNEDCEKDSFPPTFQNADEEIYLLHAHLISLSLKLVNSAAEKNLFA